MIKQIFYILLFTVCICTLTNCAAIEANRRESVVGNNKEPSLSSKKFNSANISSRPKLASPLFFLNQDEAWALCFDDKLCHTDDGGNTWKVIADKNLEYAREIYFVSSQVGYTVISEWWHTGDASKRAYIIRTQDGGKTWKKLSEVDDTSVFSLGFLDKKNGYLACKYCRFLTKDGGETWIRIIPKLKNPDDLDSPLHLLRYEVFVSPKKVWNYGEGIWYSEDEGKTWEMNVHYYEAQNLHGSCFLDENNGWIVGSDEQIWHMNDGKTWKRIKIPESLSRNDKNYPEKKCAFGNVNFVSPNEGWITRSDRSLFYTNDEGATWQIIYQSEKDFPGAIIFLDSQRGFAFSDKSEIMFTNDGGKSWKIQSISH